MHLIIWSKDRACQLDLLLRSIRWSGLNPLISVIFKTSNSKYDEAYQKLISKHDCFWAREVNDELSSFAWNTNYCIFADGAAIKDTIGFSTDDTVLYRKIPSNFQFPLLKYNECFSLRLGLNTLLQDYSVGSIQPPLNRYVNGGECITWNPSEYHPQNNYGYPYSLDMHFFNLKNIRDCVEEFNFKNTNELEGGLSHRRWRITSLTSFKKSVALNIPVNNMSGMTVAGQTNPYTTEELNAAFLDDYEISLEEIMKFSDKVVGCHQEFPLKLVKR